MKTMFAVKHKTCEYGEWCLVPKDYWGKYARIPDSHLNLKIPGMQEVSDHTYQTTDGTDGVSNLTNAGITILETPIWYFELPGYKDPDL